MIASAQFYDGFLTKRTLARGLPPAVRYDAVVVHPTVAIQVVDKVPSCRITDDETEITAAEVYSACRIQVGPDTIDGKAVIRLYVREGIPHDQCKQGIQGQQGSGDESGGGGGVFTTSGIGVGFGGLGGVSPSGPGLSPSSGGHA